VIWDQENIALETDSGNSTVAAYTHAPEGYGNLISQRRSGATSHYHFDALGSTRVLTNSAQTPTDTADYRAFGQPNASSGSTVNPFRWGGRIGYYRQPDPANYGLRARIYRDLTGRFLSQDPARLQANRYRFPGNNPVMLADPSGLQGCAHGPGGTCPHHGPSTQAWAPAGAGNGQGGHHPRRCEPQSGCQRRLTNDDWYIMCRCKEPDKRNWRCRCPHPEGWPRPPQAGMVQLVHVETCKSCGKAGDECKCHFQLWRVPILPPRRGRRGRPFREEIVDGLCKLCGGGGGGDDDGPDGDCGGNDADAATVESAGSCADPAAPEVAGEFVNLPSPGTGYTSYVAGSRQWGTQDLVDCITSSGLTWYYRVMVPRFTAARIQVGDMSFQHGGAMFPHVSHKVGVDADLRPVRCDNVEGPTTWRSRNYSRRLTQTLVSILTGICDIKMIFFNDPQISGVRYCKGHDNHLHVRANAD